MANVREIDTALWLYNKLGTSDDLWTGGSISYQLNAEVLRKVKDCFPDLQTQVKLKFLLSFFNIPKRNVKEWKTELEEILEVAQSDSEPWVSMLAEIMKTLPDTGSLNKDLCEVEENKRIFLDLVNDLKESVQKNSDLGILPLECHYLNGPALQSLGAKQSSPVRHFTLKRKPKSVVLRAELLQKSGDAQNCMKKFPLLSIPLRSRGIPRKIADTTPLKGIPSRPPMTIGFRNDSVSSAIQPSIVKSLMCRKDVGIKVLDINDQPLPYAEAKKRKKLQEVKEPKKNLKKEAALKPTEASTTSDYAAGLASLDPPSLTPSRPTVIHRTGLRPKEQDENLKKSKSPAKKLASPSKEKIASAQYKPTRELLLEAQNLFKGANKVTRPEKALILSFMMGSRDNPNPHLGNVFTVKLHEHEETVEQNDGTTFKIMVENHFQMNYLTGEWKKIQKRKTLDGRRFFYC